MSESSTQYENFQTDSSFETDDIIDVAESEQTNELTSVCEHFSKEYDTNNELTSLICTICRLKYKPTNMPGTLAKHLYNKHSNLVGNRQSTLDKFVNKPYSRTDQQYLQLTDKIVDFIVCYQLPFSIVDNSYFITILNTFDARYQIPCRQTIRTQILNKYNSMRKIILEELEKPKKVSITCDIWSFVTMQSYLGVTVHFINNEWQLQHFLLDLLPLTRQHTAVNIKQAIMQ
ncbi:759_t:CDS:2, partial [Racocetra fulgida]